MINMVSLLLGFAAWGTGLAAMVKKGSYSLTFGSLTLCGMALVAQFFEIHRRVMGADWSALMDTVPALVRAAACLLVVTAVLNAIALCRSRKER